MSHKKIHAKNAREQYIYDTAFEVGREQGFVEGRNKGMGEGYEQAMREYKPKNELESKAKEMAQQIINIGAKTIDANTQFITSMAQAFYTAFRKP